MAADRPRIDPDIAVARTLPAAEYRDPAAYRRQLERVFARSWQLVPGGERAASPGRVLPVGWLEGSLDEPLVLACGDDGELRCLSNVCTHRAEP